MFSNTVIAEWPEGEPRNMRMWEPLNYIDPTGIHWPVPAGALINGASIPQPLWPAIGSPYVGLYRRASVPHDWYCTIRTRPWQQVHKMFFWAMIEDGVEIKKAKLMYRAVYLYGPRWDDRGRDLPVKEVPVSFLNILETAFEVFA